MLKSGDPIAKQLSSAYKQVRMPNLQLTPAQVQDVIGYLDSIANPASK